MAELDGLEVDGLVGVAEMLAGGAADWGSDPTGGVPAHPDVAATVMAVMNAKGTCRRTGRLGPEIGIESMGITLSLGGEV